MSYILEALKRSQQQREQQALEAEDLTKQQSVQESVPATGLVADAQHQAPVQSHVQPINPSNARMPVAPRRWSFVKVLALGGLVLVASVVSVVMMREAPEPVSKSSVEAPLFSTATPTQPVAKETPATSEPSNTATNSAPNDSAASDVPFQALHKIPTLNVTAHLYSSDETLRSITINGRTWSQGQWLTESIQLAEIKPKGAVLEIDRRWRVFVHRSRGWQALP